MRPSSYCIVAMQFYVLVICVLLQQASSTTLLSQSQFDTDDDVFSTSLRFSVEKRNYRRDVNYNKAELTSSYHDNIHHMAKRNTDATCGQSPDASKNSKAVSSNPFPPPKSDDNYDTMTMVWTGKNSDTRLVALMHSTGDAISAVYFSKLSSDGNSPKFVASKGLENMTLTMVERNPTDTKHILAVGVRDDVYLSCVSKDSGGTFSCKTMLKGYKPAGTILFKDDRVMTIMKTEAMFADDLVLVVSNNSGVNWYIVHHDVTAALFKSDGSDTVFALTQVMDSNPFSRFGLNLFSMSSAITQLMSVNIKNPEKPTVSLLDGLKHVTVTGFQYAGDFLHVVAQDDDGHKVLKISNDHGKSFKDTHLPTTSTGQYINILNTDNKLIFAHVTSATDTAVGTLFSSGTDGLFYTNSLTDHISDDFYNVESMDGVYLTTRTNSDKSLSTMITMDRGAEWGPITVADCGQDDCTLQIYGNFLIGKHKEDSHDVLAQGPASTANAKGLIVVQGMLGKNIPYNSGTKKYAYSATPGVFISGDGGYKWKQAKPLQGAYHLVIEDSGAVIQALPINYPLSAIKYSWDEGTCWHSLPVNATLKEFTVKGLVAQPGHKSLKLGIFGHGKAGTTNQITWEVIDLDFKPILGSVCTAEDLEEWDDHQYCYLGVRKTYKRIKTDKRCYLAEDVNAANPSGTVYCPCARKNYECDYGFVKQGSDKKCVKDKNIDGAVPFCLDNYIHTLESAGYRKLPGDQCDKESPKATTYPTESSSKLTNKTCDEGNPATFLPESLAKKRLCGDAGASEASGQAGSKPGGLVAATVILTLLSTVLSVALTTLSCKYKTLRRHFDYGSFENASWDAGTGNSSVTAGSSSNKSEGIKINENSGTGSRSYTRLKETGTESDVDLLNM